MASAALLGAALAAFLSIAILASRSTLPDATRNIKLLPPGALAINAPAHARSGPRESQPLGVTVPAVSTGAIQIPVLAIVTPTLAPPSRARHAAGSPRRRAGHDHRSAKRQRSRHSAPASGASANRAAKTSIGAPTAGSSGAGSVAKHQGSLPPGLAKKPGGLPPGLAKKPGGLSPGQAKKHRK